MHLSKHWSFKFSLKMSLSSHIHFKRTLFKYNCLFFFLVTKHDIHSKLKNRHKHTPIVSIRMSRTKMSVDQQSRNKEFSLCTNWSRFKKQKSIVFKSKQSFSTNRKCASQMKAKTHHCKNILRPFFKKYNLSSQLLFMGR